MTGKCETTGKVQYASRREARVGLNKLLVRRRGHKTERSSYKCKYCDSWHLTTMGEKPGVPLPRLAPADPWKWDGTVQEEED